MEFAIMMVIGLICTAPLAGYWRARTWAKERRLRLRAKHTPKPPSALAGTLPTLMNHRGYGLTNFPYSSEGYGKR